MRAGWAAGRSFLWWMVDGGRRTPGRRVFGSGRKVVVGVWGRLAEVGIDEG